MGNAEQKSMLYLEARCLLVIKGAGVQGTQNGSISCIGLVGSVPVSYTHLDVYKRQMSFLRSTRLLECCEEGQSLCLYDTFPNQDGIGRSFVRMLCLPVEQGKQKTFLILGVFCSALEFFQRYERGGNHDKSGFDDCTYPVAVFSFSGDGPVPVLSLIHIFYA